MEIGVIYNIYKIYRYTCYGYTCYQVYYYGDKVYNYFGTTDNKEKTVQYLESISDNYIEVKNIIPPITDNYIKIPNG